LFSRDGNYKIKPILFIFLLFYRQRYHQLLYNQSNLAVLRIHFNICSCSWIKAPLITTRIMVGL